MRIKSLFFSIIFSQYSLSALYDASYLIKNFGKSNVDNFSWVGYSWPYFDKGMADQKIFAHLKESPIQKLEKLLNGHGYFTSWEKEFHSNSKSKIIDHSMGLAIASIKELEPRERRHINLYSLGRRESLSLSVADQKSFLTERWMDQGIKVLDGQNFNASNFFKWIILNLGILKRPVILNDDLKYYSAFAYEIEKLTDKSFLPISFDNLGHHLYPVKISVNIFYSKNDVYPSSITNTFSYNGSNKFEQAKSVDQYFIKNYEFILFFDKAATGNDINRKLNGNIVGEGLFLNSENIKKQSYLLPTTLSYNNPLFTLNGIPVAWDEIQEVFGHMSKVGIKEIKKQKLSLKIKIPKLWSRVLDELPDDLSREFLREQILLKLRKFDNIIDISAKDISWNNAQVELIIHFFYQTKKEDILRQLNNEQIQVFL